MGNHANGRDLANLRRPVARPERATGRLGRLHPHRRHCGPRPRRSRQSSRCGADEHNEQLDDFYVGSKSNPLAMDQNGGRYTDNYVSNMKSMVQEKTLDTVIPFDKLVDARFVDQYLGNNGWYDVTSRKGGNYLR